MFGREQYLDMILVMNPKNIKKLRVLPSN